MNRAKFIDYVKENCIHYGVECFIGRGKLLNLGENARADGYFDAENKRLAFSSKARMAVIVHEFNHLIQYISMGEKKFLSMNDLELELDCEKKSVELIKKLNLRICIDKYMRGANAYVMSYGLFKNPFEELKISPAKVDAIIKLMPTKFYPLKTYKNPPQWFREIVKEYCY